MVLKDHPDTRGTRSCTAMFSVRIQIYVPLPLIFTNVPTTHMIRKVNSFLPLPHIAPRGADKSLVRPTSRFILFDVLNISFDASLVILINSSNIPWPWGRLSL